MRRSFDVVVIGGGVAGVAAALGATAAGARVALVRATPGVTAMTSGAWHGPLPEGIGDALERAGLPHHSCDARLPHPSGETMHCAYAAAPHTGAVVTADTLVCGIEGLAGFHAPALARLWGDGGGAAAHATLALPGTPRAGWSPVALAASLERDPAPLARLLADAARGRRIARIILPAVLGCDAVASIIARLSEAAGVPVAEALGVPPSLPGWRLARALDRALSNARVEVIAGHARRAAVGARDRRVGLLAVEPHGAMRAGARVEPAAANDAAARVDLEAGCVVLATGKFAGGGIAGDARFHEPALDCPVWIEHVGQRFDAPHPLALTSADRASPQPMLAAGVRTDGHGRPVDAWDDVVYEDVIVAGSVRAGTTTTDLGLGDAAEDGWRAGALALEVAR